MTLSFSTGGLLGKDYCYKYQIYFYPDLLTIKADQSIFCWLDLDNSDLISTSIFPVLTQ